MDEEEEGGDSGIQVEGRQDQSPAEEDHRDGIQKAFQGRCQRSEGEDSCLSQQGQGYQYPSGQQQAPKGNDKAAQLLVREASPLAQSHPQAGFNGKEGDPMINQPAGWTA